MRLKTFLQNIIDKPIELTDYNNKFCNAEVKMIIQKGTIVCCLINEKYKLTKKE